MRARPADIPRGTAKLAVSKACPEMSAGLWYDNKPVLLLAAGGSREESMCGKSFMLD